MKSNKLKLAAHSHKLSSFFLMMIKFSFKSFRSPNAQNFIMNQSLNFEWPAIYRSNYQQKRVNEKKPEFLLFSVFRVVGK